MSIFNKFESNVRSYCRSFPAVFSKAKLCCLYDEHGEGYLDFFAGAGALNYGHNNEHIIAPIIEYLQNDGVLHALDMSTIAKRQFMEAFENRILNPRGLNYRIMFCGPTGTNAVEAAIKVARNVKKRNTIFSFSGAFHGVTLGSLALTSNTLKREAAGVPLNDVVFMPYPFGFNNCFDTIQYIENAITDDHSGIEKPTAVIVETLQGEGGVVVADTEWLKRLRQMCNEHDILLICDDIQAGCGRTGDYFSFERAGIVPDIVTVSKSISGSGLPLSFVLLKPELDILNSGDHNGTFRGNQLAFIGGYAAITLMEDIKLLDAVKEKGTYVTEYIQSHIISKYPKLMHRGLGLIHGIDFSNVDAAICKMVSFECFKNKLLIETAGRNQGVLKLLPPLIITMDELKTGLEIIEQGIQRVMEHYKN